MISDIQEKHYEEKSKDSVEDLLRYIMFEIKSPIEDYFLVIELLQKYYPMYKDIRLAVLGAYLTSTWLSGEDNVFLNYLNEHLTKEDNQHKAIIYYLQAYDIYMKYDNKYPKEYAELLQNSISCSKRFVYNYVRLSEITEKKQASILLDQAKRNVEHIWKEEDLLKTPEDKICEYEDFVNEFILGVDISSFEYDTLFN